MTDDRPTTTTDWLELSEPSLELGVHGRRWLVRRAEIVAVPCAYDSEPDARVFVQGLDEPISTRLTAAEIATELGVELRARCSICDRPLKPRMSGSRCPECEWTDNPSEPDDELDADDLPNMTR